jgi:hypothetical protein
VSFAWTFLPSEDSRDLENHLVSDPLPLDLSDVRIGGEGEAGRPPTLLLVLLVVGFVLLSCCPGWVPTGFLAVVPLALPLLLLLLSCWFSPAAAIPR